MGAMAAIMGTRCRGTATDGRKLQEREDIGEGVLSKGVGRRTVCSRTRGRLHERAGATS